MLSVGVPCNEMNEPGYCFVELLQYYLVHYNEIRRRNVKIIVEIVKL